jgi:hypothetical protein
VKLLLEGGQKRLDGPRVLQLTQCFDRRSSTERIVILDGGQEGLEGSLVQEGRECLRPEQHP